MIDVLGRRNSANVQKVMWTLGELELPYERHDIGGTFGYPDDYPNPVSVVPTIRDGDLVVWESNACVRYLARAYCNGRLWPEDPRIQAKADMWMEWQRSDVAFAFFPLFQMLIRGLPSTPEKIQRLVQGSARAFGQLDERLHGRAFICGDELTVADIAIGSMVYRYMTLPIERPELPHFSAWYERLSARPAYRKHVMIPYGANLDEWNALERQSAGVQ